ncbi:CHY zinc finger domain protein [Cordyceps fumosorosea ARSEF 2679]|uniref:CHY zinc finger domain protein n=1 Tax=Cordyceps fumosorosea (strain ARSEF 2679) TaxID=1081104 RepID=A0A162LGI8_CORFA|nr:CHY zinc finger domain protein [Cordyceps fumosorosea ARSEF 2679]OAA70284.1 CHY zinc finger domain protein [Cordyceps fumosorosea ARSEF 2679]
MLPLHLKDDGAPTTRQQAVTEPSSSRVVAKPVPKAQLQDPRGYQLGQVARRYSPKETINADGSTSLVFKMTPSDPDFPFELAHLHCDLLVPKAYPAKRPALRVTNKDIPRGFSINVEKGWDKLAEERKGSTLLSLINALDKNLEIFLSEQKVETVKLVHFKDTRHLQQEPLNSEKAPAVQKVMVPLVSASKPSSPRPYVPEKKHSREEIAVAKERRAQEVRQLEARMGRLPLYRRSADGVVFTLPLEPKKKADLPEGLRSVNNLHLIVPLLYPLQDIRVQLNEADAKDAEPVEDLFVQRAADQKQMNLMGHVNYLAQNLHLLAKMAQLNAAKAEMPQPQETNAEPAEGQSSTGELDTEKSHIQYIPRPPEWTIGNDSGSSEEEGTSSSDDGGVELETGEEKTSIPMSDAPEHGTMISFPAIELHGLELLQVSLLSLTIKCDRCRTLNDLTGIKPGLEKAGSCKKCASAFSAKYNPQYVHEHSSRAGFIDLSGCKVADMLPSTFVPTCARCSTPSGGLVSVRGETTTNVCRECHAKFTFKIPDVKFLFITPGTRPPPTSGPKRKTEKLGLHAGEPLPGRGACVHYRKSYRWFRFSCCNKVFACDRCHEEAEDHPNEWANRMICGWCSREQNYAVDECRFCGRGVIGKKGRGFWEGGKGTRDQRMMSRKDPRKYKRIGTQPGAKKS